MQKIQLDSFKEIVLDYKVVFFDAFGVLKNVKGLIPGVPDTLEFLKQNNIDFYVLTNDASRSPHQLAESYHKLGVSAITPQKMISSGMLAREYLRYKVSDGVVAYLGTPNSAHYIDALGWDTLAIADLDLESSVIDDVRALVLLDDEGFDWNSDINKTVNLLRRRNIPVIVANTDRAYPVSKHEVAIAVGGLANLLETILGRKFIRFGKPDAQMFIYAFDHVMNSQNLSKNDILMVGDTLHTDIIGGNKFGIDTALVLSGNTIPDQAPFYIQSTGIVPDFICESVAVY